MGRTLSAILRRHEQAIALALAGITLLVCGVAPFLALAAGIASGWTDALAVFESGRPMALLARSLALAAAITLVALALGVPLGVLVGRTDVLGRWPAVLLHAFPVFLPPFLVALGWFHLVGAGGLVGSPATSRVLFSPVGMIAVLSLAFAPIAMALVALGLQSVDPSLEEAARTMAAPVRVVLRILLPAAAPAMSLAALVIFTLSLSELGVPMFLRVETFPPAVFARLGGIDYAPGEAFALILPLIPIALLLVAFERRFVGTRSLAVLGVRTRDREWIALGRWRGPASVGVGLVAAVSVLPLAALTWRAWSGGAFGEVGNWLGRAPWNSLSTAATAASVIVGIGIVLGHASARRDARARVLDTLAVLSFVAPAAVLGVGLIATWNRPALQVVYGSAAILVVGYVGRYAVVGMRALAVLVAQTPVQLEEAAAAAGAGYLRRVTRILIPLHRRGIAFAWLLAVVFCLRDLDLPILYYPAGGEPSTVRLFTLEANGPEAVVSALAVTHAAMTAVVVAAAGWLVAGRARG